MEELNKQQLKDLERILKKDYGVVLRGLELQKLGLGLMRMTFLAKRHTITRRTDNLLKYPF